MPAAIQSLKIRHAHVQRRYPADCLMLETLLPLGSAINTGLHREFPRGDGSLSSEGEVSRIGQRRMNLD